MVKITINNKEYQAEEGCSILEVALHNGIEISHLCYHENLSVYGGCRLCLVEVTRNGKKKLTTSCTYPVADGIVVETNTPRVKRARRLMMELLLAMAPESPRLQAYARELGVNTSRFKLDGDGCIRCGLCVHVCDELVGANALAFANKGDKKTVVPPFEEPENCIGCGACAFICPTDCIGIEESGDERKIKRWNKTVKMKQCTICGRLFIPYAQIEYALQKAGGALPEEWFEKCPDCR